MAGPAGGLASSRVTIALPAAACPVAPEQPLPLAHQVGWGHLGGRWPPVSYTHLTLPTICSV
eukprot:7734862-Alexandrium_andersonii.AAC.1